MRNNRGDKKRGYLLVGLSGCLLILVFLMFLGTAALTGIYLYDRYGLPQLADFLQETPPVTPAATATPLPASPPALASLPAPIADATTWPTPTLIRPADPTEVPAIVDAGSGLPVTLDQDPVPDNARAYLERLYLADHPAYDYFDSAVRLGKLDIGSRTFSRPGFSPGDRFVFQTADGPIEATLKLVSEHAYFWVDDALAISESDLLPVANELENNLYSRVNHLFGQPWAPGIDGDPRFAILHLASVGNRYELGFFSDQDEYPRTLFRDSNEQEIVYLNMGQLQLGSDLYYGTLVHELQHLFQWNLDKNEATWFNEGLSQLAELYAGLQTVSPEPYLSQPAIRLNLWSYSESDIDAHYGASYLFVVYLWEQLGEAGMYELVRHPANGLTAVRSVLQGFVPDRSLHSFIADWAVANYLDDPFAGERYAYARLDLPRPVAQGYIQEVPYTNAQELEQFAVNYIEISRPGPVTITFAGDTTARLIDAAPTSGEQMWYALPYNDSDAQLTARFDLRQLERATLTFNAWYDLEEDYDFAYVSVSADNGATWDLLYPLHSRTGDYGPALTGESALAADAAAGWIRETLSLNQYAGSEILLRFHVLTDFETTGKGFALDDIAITELGFFDDVESGSGNWEAQGFVRTGWQLPQEWEVRLILHGEQPQVIPLTLNPLNQVRQPVELGADGGTLVIIPLTPFVEDSAQYWL
ncbi:MAG: hypothetical protein ACK2UK_00410, partial [Candidatus Promineifilaceae bacterium]